jgi:hypothetical protein
MNGLCHPAYWLLTGRRALSSVFNSKVVARRAEDMGAEGRERERKQTKIVVWERATKVYLTRSA